MACLQPHHCLLSIWSKRNRITVVFDYRQFNSNRVWTYALNHLQISSRSRAFCLKLLTHLRLLLYRLEQIRRSGFHLPCSHFREVYLSLAVTSGGTISQVLVVLAVLWRSRPWRSAHQHHSCKCNPSQFSNRVTAIWSSMPSKTSAVRLIARIHMEEVTTLVQQNLRHWLHQHLRTLFQLSSVLSDHHHSIITLLFDNNPLQHERVGLENEIGA